MKASASRVSRGPYQPSVRGIASWEDVSALVEHFSYHREVPWLFRGVSSTVHDLVPLVGREDWRRPDSPRRGRTTPHLPYSKRDELAVFAMFQNTAVAFLDKHPASRMEWLAVARHYGVPTRFLDWSDRFLVAVWFAVNGYLEEGDAGQPGVWVVWGLKSVTARDLDNPFGVRAPRIYRPPHIVPRFSTQGSVLSIQGDPTRPLAIRTRMLIPIERHICLDLMKRLDDCGLNYATVYSDVDGLGRYMRWRYRNGWLAGY
jgi:hypothetical protein